MDEQADPAPKPQSAPTQPRSAAPAAGYTAPPIPARAPRRRPVALLTALVLGAVVIGFGLSRRAAPAPTARPLVEVMGAPILYQNDFDARTTSAARELLLSHPTPRELLALQESGADGSSARSAALQQALRQLAAGTQELRDGLIAGHVAFYTIDLPNSSGGEGDVYDISIDGSSLFRVTAGPKLASVTIPLDSSKRHVVTQTLVFSQANGGGVKPVAIEPLPAALAGFPEDASSRPKAPRCIVHLQDGDGKNEHVIGDFPCDCGAVHWAGSVGSCSIAK